MSSFPKATRESLPVSESSQHLALRTNVLEGRFCELRLHLILGSRTFTLRSSRNFTCAVLRRPKTLAATPDDVGSGFLGGDPTLCRSTSPASTPLMAASTDALSRLRLLAN